MDWKHKTIQKFLRRVLKRYKGQLLIFHNCMMITQSEKRILKNDGSRFRSLELLPKDELLQTTKSLVPEQKVVLQKELDFAKTVVQCSNSKVARDTPNQMGLILYGVGKSLTTKICSQWIGRAGGKPEKSKILLLCPTGMTVNAIDGMTIC